MNEQAISKIFCDYVARMEDQERHTDAAVQEADALDAFLSETFPGNTGIQISVYDKAMDVAVEFEESGFIAGFMMAMQMFADVPGRKATA